MGGQMELRADLEALHATSRSVAELHADIADEWSALAKRAEDLFGGSWSGAAADSYAEPWAHCCEGLGHVLNGLSTMGQLLASAAQTYAERDTSGAKVIERTAFDIALRLP
ncbi:hypothetical protein GORBP_028_00550 [Gordonia rubripertincta NBRC 101908]|uniref:ESAT-6-like protein n=2 Tax=Gordonia rubripertincta TaxID=36822 RepID=A0ABQ0HP55_GORRU|nr:WXG100 family type VII secretion target [Gordonia rubripertincta]GAB84052.1 hypothetical protein GORBP_028_00550 [Gordonia rubripertincta NBRC 101908]